MHSVFTAQLPGLLITLVGLLLCLSNARAQAIPSDDNLFSGDHLRLFTNLHGIQKAGASDGAVSCAPLGSRLSVSNQSESKLYVRFIDVPKLKKDSPELKDCPEAEQVNKFTDYEIATDALLHSDFRRSGFAFGALVVPFKLRLGKEKQLVSSSTVAPFVGFRTAWSVFGLGFTPVVAIGLSNVPVTNPATNTTESKAAFTTAIGFRVTSSKNEKFNAGMLLGHDFLNRSDRNADATVGKPWMSIYLGYAI